MSSFGFSGTIAHVVLLSGSDLLVAASRPTLSWTRHQYFWGGTSSSPQHLHTVEGAFQLRLTSPGSVNNIVVEPQSYIRTALGKMHCELSVQASGLNFRDVLNMLDLDPTRSVRPIGLECAAMTVDVGGHVGHIQAEDCVYGMASGCLASLVRIDARLQVEMPQALTFEEACTLPILWCTAALALAEKMRLTARQGLLVHAVTGGVGTVALEFAMRVSALVCGSVGRPSKVAHLRETGVHVVTNSRDSLSFVYGATVSLQKRRLFGVVSALSRGFIPTSVAVLNDQSKFLEVGKNNIWSARRMCVAASSDPFCLVACDYQSAEWTKSKLDELTRRVDVNEVCSLPLTVFDFTTASMINAFNQLRRGDHIGRYVASIAHAKSSHGNKRTETGTEQFDVFKCLWNVEDNHRRSRIDGYDTYVCVRIDSSTGSHLTSATLEINDPAHFNTLSSLLGDDMHHAAAHLANISEVTSVLLQGAGAHFSIGGNPYGTGATSARPPNSLHLRELYDGFLQLHRLNCPFACAVHGTLVGGGIAACMHADIRVAELGTQFEHGACICMFACIKECLCLCPYHVIVISSPRISGLNR